MTLVPSLTRNQWLWLGGAAALGVTEVVSAPIAVALAALPILDNLASGEESKSGRRSNSGGTTIGTPRVARRRRTAKRAGRRKITTTTSA